jgi:hypothetical protein
MVNNTTKTPAVKAAGVFVVVIAIIANAQTVS